MAMVRSAKGRPVSDITDGLETTQSGPERRFLALVGGGVGFGGVAILMRMVDSSLDALSWAFGVVGVGSAVIGLLGLALLGRRGSD